VGEAFSRISAGDRVDRSAEQPEATFGIWFSLERRLRQVSVEFVSVRTRIPLERIWALEAGRVELPPDGNSRAMARALAEAIGADPDEAAARVGGYPHGGDAAGARRLRRWIAAAVALLLLVLAGLAGIWSAVSVGPVASESRAEGVEESPVVHRPDHLFRLLEEPEG
jgi:hypothetical protein